MPVWGNHTFIENSPRDHTLAREACVMPVFGLGNPCIVHRYNIGQQDILAMKAFFMINC